MADKKHYKAPEKSSSQQKLVEAVEDGKRRRQKSSKDLQCRGAASGLVWF